MLKVLTSFLRSRFFFWDVTQRSTRKGGRCVTSPKKTEAAEEIKYLPAGMLNKSGQGGGRGIESSHD